jgi:hypothetical protein
LKASAVCALILAPFIASPAVVAQNADSGSYFSNWFDRVNRTQAAQPHWITPLFTTTPRLEEEFRSDITWTPAAGGENLNYGGGKGLELIPTEQTEIIIGVPPYQVPAQGPAGGGNIPLLLKYRLFASNEQHSNYLSRRFWAAAFRPAASPRSTARLLRPSPLARGTAISTFRALWAGRSRPAAAKPAELRSPTTPHFNTVSFVNCGQNLRPT